MRKLSALIAGALTLLVFQPEPGQAIPAFARKYGFNCQMCHTSFTKLNDYGQRFRDNGYQQPGQEGLEKSIFETFPPLSLRTSTGLMIAHDPDAKRTTSGFHLKGLDLLAAGVMHKNISFLLIYTPRIDEPGASYSSAGSMDPSQPGALESANLVFSNLIQDALSLRVGRFEPAYHPISSKRSYYLLQPYEVYAFSTPGNSFVFNDNQIGIEATGHFREGIKYGAGIVNGNGANPDNNNAKDLYANLSKTIGRGDGQSSGQRIGAFAYYGWMPTSILVPFSGETGDADGKDNEPFYRVGGHISLNWMTFNLQALMMYGADDKQINNLRYGEKYHFTGGFGRLDWAGLPNNRLLASALFNWVTPPDYDRERRIQAMSALVRYYLGDWAAVNVALHGEYTFRQQGDVHLVNQHQFAALLDFGF
jgi:hypothetical protein